MKVFISWSKGESKALGEALAEWLPQIQQQIEPCISTEMGAGVNWINKLQENLKTSDFGIICVTRDNMNNPWLNFEAGALSIALQDERIAPVLYNLALSQIAQSWPLHQYQAVSTDRSGIWKLVKTVNSYTSQPLTESSLKSGFDRWWPEFERMLTAKLDAQTTEASIGEGLITMQDFVREEQKLQDGDHVYLFSNNLTYDMRYFGEVIRNNLNRGVQYCYLIEDAPEARSDWRRFISYLESIGANALPVCKISTVSPRMWTTAIYDKQPPQGTEAISILEYTDESEECVRYTSHTAKSMRRSFLNLWDKAIPFS